MIVVIQPLIDSRLSFSSNCVYMKQLLALIAVSLPGLVMAHPGHGHDDGWSIVHYIFNYEHAIPLAFAVIVAIILFSRVKVARKINKDI